jgi:putative ABC transport system permease protein
VSADYLRAMSIQLLRGRWITSQDAQRSTPVIVINDTMARQMWPGQDPIGRRYKRGWPEQEETWREIVGVVADVKVLGVTDSSHMQVYFPFAQDPPQDFAFVIRSRPGAPAGQLVQSFEDTVRSIHADIPVYDEKAMTTVMAESFARERTAGVVLALFAIVGLALAVVGLYGLMSQDVTERRRELSIRMALGADRATVVRLVITAGGSMVLTGAVVGIAASLGVSRALQDLLFGVQPRDPLAIVLAAGVLIVAGVVACLIPTYRALRIPPSEVLKA